jgi:hypothetical protein
MLDEVEYSQVLVSTWISRGNRFPSLTMELVGSRTLSDSQLGSSEDLSSESNTTFTTFNGSQDPSESGSSRRQ